MHDDAGGLYLPDTPEGRAVELCANAISDRSTPGQLAMCRKLARIALGAMVRLCGPDQASQYFASLSRDALEMRGFGRGRTGKR
jgi:hypothetical protein